MELGPDDIREILRIFSESELEELRLELGNTRLHVSKRGGPWAPSSESPIAGRDATSTPVSSALDPPSSASPAPPSVAAGTAASSVADATLVDLKSPLLGVFYRRPSPDKPQFVEIGTEVSSDDPVCIVDVMKMFTQVPAGAAGRIAEICVQDGELVEHGQVLMRIEPA